MAVTGRFVTLTKYDLIVLLKQSGVLAREYGIHTPYAVEFTEMGDIQILGSTSQDVKEPQ